MASCKLCSSLGSTKIEYNRSMAKEHVDAHLLQLRIFDKQVSESRTYEQCFPAFVAKDGRSDFHTPGHQSVADLCNTLFATRQAQASAYVTCRQCNNKLKAFSRQNHLESSRIIEHACSHLRLSLYKCGICARWCHTVSSLFSHLSDKHQISTAIGHFQNHFDDFTEEISTMVKECFDGNESTISPNTSATRINIISIANGSRKPSTDRQLFCAQLIRKFADRDRKLKCHLCAKKISVAGHGKEMAQRNVMEHAFLHLQKGVYRCRLCSDAFATRSAVMSHLTRHHGRPSIVENFECLVEQYHREILAALSKCYGDGGDDSNPKVDVESNLHMVKEHSPLAAERQSLCYQLIQKHADPKRRLRCRLCSKEISAMTGSNKIKTSCVIQHVLLHIGKSVYRCKICSKTFIPYGVVLHHLKMEHALPMSDKYYECFADQCHDEIVAMIRRCYEVEAAVADTSECSTSQVAHKSMVPSMMTVERLDLCKRIHRKYAKDQKVRCRLCKKGISVKMQNGIGGDAVTRHALIHLEVRVYKCRLCASPFNTRPNMSQHLKQMHALPLTNNYECLADQHHADIVATLVKCYGKA